MILETIEISYLCIRSILTKERVIVMDTTMNQGVFLSIPKSDIKFFKDLGKKMCGFIDIR